MALNYTPLVLPKPKHEHTELQLWLYTIIFSLTIFFNVGLYISFTVDHTPGFLELSQMTAITAMILIGLSFELSGISYFFKFTHYFLQYRKYLGLAGFAFVVAHTIFALIRFPFPKSYLTSQGILPFICAVIALVIFTLMTIISNNYWMHRLGGPRWRFILRLGYVAYIFSMIHYIMRTSGFWAKWFVAPHTLPPLGFLITFYAAGVLLLRICLSFSLALKKVKK